MENNLELIISKVFTQLRSMLPTPQQIITRYKMILENKKRRCKSNEEDYIDRLLIEIEFLEKVSREVLALFIEYLRSNRFPSRSGFASERKTIQEEAKRVNPYTLIHNRKLYERYQTDRAKIDQLRYDYMYHDTMNQLMLNFVRTFVGHQATNRGIINEIKQYNLNTVEDCIKKYCAVNTNIILDNYKLYK